MRDALRITLPIILSLLVVPVASAQSNLVVNGGFDNGLSPWQISDPSQHHAWAPQFDSNQSPSSGSVALLNALSAPPLHLSQCVALGSPATYGMGTKVYVHSSSDGLGRIGVGVEFFNSSDCTGSFQLRAETFYRDSFPFDSWRTLERTSGPLEPATTVRSARVYVFLEKSGGSQLAANFDDVHLSVVGQVTPPPEISFQASPRVIRRGDAATLVWTTQDATSVSIDQGVGSQPVDGSTSVSPAQTTIYTMTATGPGGTATSQVMVEVIATPEVVLGALPEPLVQDTSEEGATTAFVLTNAGGASTSISLTPDGGFFTLAPMTLTLEPGQRERIMVTALQRATGTYRGRVLASGAGVPAGFEVPIQLLVSPAPEAPTSAQPAANRLDLAAPVGTNPTGMAEFRNTGQAKIQGMLRSSVPWMIPQSGLIEIDPGESRMVTFSIDRSRRPPRSEVGSLEGRLGLVFRTGPASKGSSLRNGTATTTSLVTVVDTSKPQVTPGSIPALEAGEVALFIPGAGNVAGGSGLFFSDISVVNLSGSNDLGDVRMYYTPLGEGAQTLTTTISSLAAGTPLPLADVVRTVFDSEATLGSLQIRSSNIGQISANANIFLRRSGDQKIFGNTIPAFRSDRSVQAGGSLYLTGLTRTGNDRTNLFIQETAGGNVVVDIEFFSESGQKIGERNGVTAGPFRLTGLFYSAADPILPVGTVSAIITSRPDSTGRFAAYATPVDGEASSGDSWSLADWNIQNAFAGDDEMLVPVAGALQGGGGLFFRTDLAFFNRGTTQAAGILRYITRPGEGRAPIDRMITLGSRESLILEDVTTSLFDVDPSQFTLGYLKFLPQSGSVALTSRNFATQGEDPGTFGTGVATLPLASSMRLGDVRRIGGVKDASLQRFLDATPGTFRSNFAMMETTGIAPVTVRVTVHFTYSTGTTAVARGSGSKEYGLQPGEYIQLSRISREVLGEAREDLGDFDNLQVDFAVVGGDGAATVFVSSVENDSGDSILRVD